MGRWFLWGYYGYSLRPPSTYQEQSGAGGTTGGGSTTGGAILDLPGWLWADERTFAEGNPAKWYTSQTQKVTYDGSADQGQSAVQDQYFDLSTADRKVWRDTNAGEWQALLDYWAARKAVRATMPELLYFYYIIVR